MDDGIHVLDAWKPTNPPLMNRSDNRSPKSYMTVAAQFDVCYNPRYTPGHQGHGETYCNIFVWDVTKAMGCEVPHWADEHGSPCPVGKGSELDANAVCDWLDKDANEPEVGSWFGWREATKAVDVIAAVTRGYPTVAAWKNPGGIGHVAMVLPTSNNVLHIAAAGHRNFFDSPIGLSFGRHAPRFFYHE